MSVRASLLSPHVQILLAAVALSLTVIGGLIMFSGPAGEGWAILRSGDGDRITGYIDSFGVWAPVVSVGLMALQGLIAPVPGMLIMIANGAAFGPFWGGVITLVGQLLAGSLCFGLSRTLGRGPAERLIGAGGMQSANRQMERWGSPGLILARLIPGVSFDAVSWVAGLTTLTFRRFLLLTTIGAAPQAFLYAWLIGSNPTAAWALAGVTTAIIGIVIGTAWFRRRMERNRRKIARVFGPPLAISEQT